MALVFVAIAAVITPLWAYCIGIAIGGALSSDPLFDGYETRFPPYAELRQAIGEKGWSHLFMEVPKY